MPLVIIAAFLLFTLVVGVYFSRKKTTFQEYAVGSKNFPTATLVATVLATWYGGSQLVFNVECVHEYGLLWVITFLDCFGLFMISKLALRMGPFMKHLSIAETIGSIYGRYPRFVASLIGICSCIVLITMQINVISKAISMCITLTNPYLIPIFSTLLLIFYSTFGGIRAVAFTDLLQFATFSIIIPLLCWFMYVDLGKPVSEIVPLLQNQPKFQLSSLFHFNIHLVAIFFLVLSSLGSYIDPQIVQRVYMASSPIQAQKVFSYATVFNFFIGFFIILTGLFVVLGAPDLQTVEIWPYIMTHIPSPFKGFLAISLLAMAMSTADSGLNTCAVMVGHDILKILYKGKEINDANQLKIARRTTLVVGLLAMLLAFRCKNLLQLLYWSFDFQGPILTAPFILAVFGFRGTARTALIGMAAGILTILAWNQWIEPLTTINGAFVAIVANGLAMMAAHYFLKQPPGAGWTKPDNDFKQMQQADQRQRSERKEAFKNSWANKKVTLAKFVPSPTTMVYVGCYSTITSLMGYFVGRITHYGSWLIFQLFVAAFFVGYPFISGISKKVRAIPNWLLGLFWLVWLGVYLPRNLVWHWYYLVDPIFGTSLFLLHCSLILWLLPLYLGIVVVAITLLLSVYPIFTALSCPLLSSLFPLFIAVLLMFAMIICFKLKVGNLTKQIFYLKEQENIREAQQLKASLYDASLMPSNGTTPVKGYGFILNQVVRKVEESISFLDNHTPLFKEDFQSIINKFYDWVIYFNRKEKAKNHALLQPAKINLDKLMRKVEIALSQQMVDPPRLLVETINAPNGILCRDIVFDINQVVYLLVKTVLRIGRLADVHAPIVRIQFHSTVLRFKQTDAIDDGLPVFIDFEAIALVINQAITPSELLPKVKECYAIDIIEGQGQKDGWPSIDLEQDTLSSMARAHYGYAEASVLQQHAIMLLVLPTNVAAIRDKMTIALPLDALTSDGSITSKEQADSMMTLMAFYDHVCKSLSKEDPVDLKIISGLILLLRKHFRFKRHASGQLFYVRSVGITELVIDWVFYSPKVIYASLLYELVRRTSLPLSYIKKHYNLGVYAFVSNVLKIDKREELNHPSLVYVHNRLEKAIKEDHVQLSVLFIKLAERLYDLRHAAGYIHAAEVEHMAQETLNIDVQIANTHLGTEIGQALEVAAKAALQICRRKEAEKNKHKNS